MFRTLMIGFAIVALAACATESPVLDLEPNASAAALARRAGLNPKGASIRRSYLVAESDILLPVDTALGLVDRGASLLWVSNTQADTGLYTLDVSNLPSWAGNAETAARSWTFGLSTGVRFIVSTSGPIAGTLGTVTLLPYTSSSNPYCPGAGVAACATFRSGARLGTFIAINTDFFASAPYTSSAWRASILSHAVSVKVVVA